MTEQQRAFWHRVDSWGTYASRFSAILALLVLVFGYVFWVRDWIVKQDADSTRLDELVEAYDKLSKVVEDQAQELEAVSRNLDIATRPKKIFEVDVDRSGPRFGSCTEYSSCLIDVRMRRTLEGLPCTVVPGSDRYYFLDESGVRVEVTKLSGTPLTNIQRDWFIYSWNFEMPGEMIDPISFIYSFTYTHCRGPEDNARITAESEEIPVRLVRSSPARIEQESTTPDANPAIDAGGN